MPPDILPFHFIGNSRVDATLRRLYADTLRVDPVARQAAAARGLDESASDFYAAMKDAYMPVTPDLGMLLYLLLRSSQARTVVEFGTSFGISAIWIAAALRSNGGGQLITTEMDTGKAERARINLTEAGLNDLVEIRTGAAEQTLTECRIEEIDFLLLDGAKSAYLAVLHLLESNLRPGAMIMADNTGMPDARPFLDYVDEPRNGYWSANIATEALGALHPCKLIIRAPE